MPNNSDIRAGGAYVEIGGDNNPLQAVLQASAAMMQKWGNDIAEIGKGLAAIGAAITVPLTAVVKLSTDAGAALFDMSKRTGIGIEALSRLGFVADLTGTNLAGFETGIRRMQKTIAGVKDEFEGTSGSLAHLGIAAEDIKNLSPDKQFALIASKIREIADPTRRAAAAMMVFGRTNTDLLPMIASLDHLGKSADAFGLIETTGSIREAKEFSMTLKTVEAITKSLGSALSSALTPVLKRQAEFMGRITVGVRTLVRENPQLIATTFRLATALTAGGVALYGLGKGLSIAGAVLAGIAPIVGAILSPVGLLTVGLAGLATYFAATSQAGQRMFDYLRSRFKFLTTDAFIAFQGVRDALFGSDLKLAAQITWTAIEIGWLTLKSSLSHIFDDLSEAFQVAWIRAMASAKTLWLDFKDFLMQTWSQIAAQLKTMWDKQMLTILTTLRTQAQSLGITPLVTSLNGYISTLNGQIAAATAGGSKPMTRDDIAKTRDDALAAIQDRNRKQTGLSIPGMSPFISPETIADAQMKALVDRLLRLAGRAKDERKNAPEFPTIGEDVKGPPLDWATRIASSAASTFNPNAVFGLAGGGGPMVEVAKNTGDIKKNTAETKRTADKIYRDMKLKFTPAIIT